jgi:hypothetical protein
VRADERAVGETGQEAPLLLLRAVLEQVDRAAPEVVVHGEDEAVVGAPVAERLERDDRRQRIEAAPAVLGRDRPAEHAEARAPFPALAREARLAVGLANAVAELGPGEGDDLGAQRELLRRQGKVQRLLLWSIRT